MTPSVVFDCMVFLQGAGHPQGPAAACIDLVDADRVELHVSGEILAEILDVMTRPKTLRRFPLLSPELVRSFVDRLSLKAVWHDDIPRAVTVPRDPKDEPYVNLAVAAAAKYLVTRDCDLLSLLEDDDFRRRFPDLRILEPAAFLRETALAQAAGGAEAK